MCTAVHGHPGEQRTTFGIMPVIGDHPPFGLGISARYAGDRGAERPVLEPHDHLHNKQSRTSANFTWPCRSVGWGFDRYDPPLP